MNQHPAAVTVTNSRSGLSLAQCWISLTWNWARLLLSSQNTTSHGTFFFSAPLVSKISITKDSRYKTWNNLRTRLDCWMRLKDDSDVLRCFLNASWQIICWNPVFGISGWRFTSHAVLRRLNTDSWGKQDCERWRPKEVGCYLAGWLATDHHQHFESDP